MNVQRQPTLIRVLSTGRAGTKFIASAFANQGYLAFHEGLYAGEPSAALITYTNMLGDIWFHDRDRYFLLESNFPQPYVQTVNQLLGVQKPDTQSRGWLTSLRTALTPKVQRLAGKVDVLIDCNHLLTTATPMIDQAFDHVGIKRKYLVLFRNPLKMIHAIYKVEAPDYWARSSSFNQGEDYLKAAHVWANSYYLIHDIVQHSDTIQIKHLQLESFSNQVGYAQDIFDFLEIPFYTKSFREFTKDTITNTVRSTKYDTARNSDLFHDPEFSFDDQQIEAILEVIEDVLPFYKLDGQECADQYRHFHQQEKQAYTFQ